MTLNELVEWHVKNNHEPNEYISDNGMCMLIINDKHWAVSGDSEGATFTINDLEDK